VFTAAIDIGAKEKKILLQQREVNPTSTRRHPHPLSSFSLAETKTNNKKNGNLLKFTKTSNQSKVSKKNAPLTLPVLIVRGLAAAVGVE
jgi:hypothetical protein